MTIPDASVIRHIASWSPGTVTTSLYLDVDGLRHPRWPEVERRADRLFREGRERARLASSDAEAGVEADLTEIRSWLDRGLDRSATRGVALFACAGKGLFEAVQLSVPVRDQVVVDTEPDVAQLCLVAAASPTFIAAVVDKERWRMLRSEPGGHLRELDLLDDVMPRRVDVDIELAGFERHEEELARQHFRRVGRGVAAELTRQPARYLVLLGTEESVRAVGGYLPRQVADRVAGRRALPTDTGRSELAAAAWEVVGQAERRRRSAVVATLRERALTGASAVTGLGPTLDALGAGQVATLVVERSFEAPGGRCKDCRLLVVGAGRCPRCGGPIQPSPNVVDAAIADAFLHHSVLEPVEDGSLGDLGRIGALVRRSAAGSGGPGDA